MKTKTNTNNTTMKKWYKIAAVAMIIAVIVAIFPKGKAIETGEEAPVSSMIVSVKATELLMNDEDAAFTRAVSYARNVKVDLYENGQLVAENAITGQGSVAINGNTATYREGEIVVSIDNLGLGTINVTVEWRGNVESVAFNATNVGGSNGETLNKVDIHSYALPESERNIMDPNKGYHENVLGELVKNGNTVGSISREEILGTTEADRVIEKEESVTKVETSEGDRLHTEAEKMPEEPTVELKPEEEIPMATPETTPAPTPEVEATPSTPTPTPETVVDAEKDSAMTNDDAKKNEITLSSAYAQIFVITENGTVTLFGNGSDNLVIEGELAMTDLGNGFVQTEYGIFAK